MKTFKINKYIFLVSILLLISCQDFLDVSPKDSLDEEYVFGSVNNARSAVMGVYSTLTSHSGAPFKYFPHPADDTMGNFNGVVRNARHSIYRFDLRATNSELPTPFNALYSGIERANICIYNIPKMELYKNGEEKDQATLKRLYGEVLVLRAYFYSELIKYWGDVPAPFEPSIVREDQFLTKTDRQVIYDSILDDLKEAITLLPWINDEGVEKDERITKGAAMALRARIALFAGGYSLRKSRTMERVDNYMEYYKIAEDECLKMINRRDQHTLNLKYETLFKALTALQRDPVNEVIFQIGYSPTHSGEVGHFDGPSYYLPGEEIGNGGGGAYMLPTYFYEFDSVDVRRDITIAPYRFDFGTEKQQFRGLTYMMNGKFRVDWRPEMPTYTRQTGINWPLIRFSDVLLMYAESNNEINNGPSQKAIDAYEEVRIRGFDGDKTAIGITPTDKEKFFEAIVKERLLEFGGEGIRKFDLIRWNIYGKTIHETMDNLIKMRDGLYPYDKLPGAMYVDESNRELKYANSFYEPPAGPYPGYTGRMWINALTLVPGLIDNYAPYFKENIHELLPIPQVAINTNPNLTQDYGYE